MVGGKRVSQSPRRAEGVSRRRRVSRPSSTFRKEKPRRVPAAAAAGIKFKSVISGDMCLGNDKSHGGRDGFFVRNRVPSAMQPSSKKWRKPLFRYADLGGTGSPWKAHILPRSGRDFPQKIDAPSGAAYRPSFSATRSSTLARASSSFRTSEPPPSSPQSPLLSGRPVGHPSSAPLRLLSQGDPLRWARLGFPSRACRRILSAGAEPPRHQGFGPRGPKRLEGRRLRRPASGAA